MITFVVTKNDITKNFDCKLDGSILSLKNDIIKDFNLTSKYVDLDFQLEKPIRELGKFNLESGIIPRTLDGYTFNRYGLDGKTVTATFHEVLDYQPKKYERSFKHVNLSKKYNRMDKRERETEVTYDINSNDDFPSL
jgi:hypothetical protein